MSVGHDSSDPAIQQTADLNLEIASFRLSIFSSLKFGVTNVHGGCLITLQDNSL